MSEALLVLDAPHTFVDFSFLFFSFFSQDVTFAIS